MPKRGVQRLGLGKSLTPSHASNVRRAVTLPGSCIAAEEAGEAIFSLSSSVAWSCWMSWRARKESAYAASTKLCEARQVCPSLNSPTCAVVIIAETRFLAKWFCVAAPEHAVRSVPLRHTKLVVVRTVLTFASTDTIRHSDLQVIGRASLPCFRGLRLRSV